MCFKSHLIATTCLAEITTNAVLAPCPRQDVILRGNLPLKKPLTKKFILVNSHLIHSYVASDTFISHECKIEHNIATFYILLSDKLKALHVHQRNVFAHLIISSINKVLKRRKREIIASAWGFISIWNSRCTFEENKEYQMHAVFCLREIKLP